MPPGMRRGIVFGGLTVALALTVVGTATAAAPPEGPRLAVVKWNLPLFRFELETVDPTGALPLRLAGGGERRRPLPEIFDSPSWSLDGSKVVFAGTAGSLDAGPLGDQLYVVAADGGRPMALRGTRGAASPVVSPDGRSVAFARYRSRPKLDSRGKRTFSVRGASIWLADLAGGPSKRFTRGRRGLFMFPDSFSPDSSTLLATRFAGKHREVVAVRRSTGRIEALRRGENSVYSPDGSQVALVRWRPLRLLDGSLTMTSDVYLMTSDGTGLRRLTRTRRRDEVFPSWDPSGERLAFVRFPPAIDEINEREEIGVGNVVVQMNADGSCSRRVLSVPRTAIYGVTWQPGPGREAGRISCGKQAKQR